MTELDSLPEDERSVELSSIAAIYPEIKIDPSSPFKASLTLPVKPSAPLRVCFQQQSETEFPAVLTPPTSVDANDPGFPFKTGDHNSASLNRDSHTLSHLPPICLEIELPQGYPSEEPPIFRLETNPPWLPPSILSGLLDDGKRLWEECGKDLVVYTYIDHLQQLGESAFGVGDISGGEVQLPRELKIALLDFNNKAERERFEEETFECGVCLEPKKGTICHRLVLCGHIFCVPCLQDFYNSCITEGDVEGVKCLAPGCDRTLSPSELLQIPLEQETVQRYVFLKRKKKLEADKSTVYCPRQWWEEAQLPPMSERVAICEDCNYAFCCVCKKGWHGELVRCFPRREAELSAEEKATEEYLRMYTSACPTCDAPCQKQMGCNHMICFKCDTHFCYLCSSWLCEDNPYRHFNDINSGCFNRLWDLEGGDGINPDGAAALHRVPDELLDFDDGSDDEDLVAWELGRRPPPPAPVPPRVNNGAAGGNRHRGNNANDLDAAGRAAAAERQAQARAMAEVRRRPDGEPPQVRRPGLQRFLDLVLNDREDEWDSDELDDDF
ncbi:uncharacterized protein An15g01450 [Aspergillus niger]|uniref:RBR-type E3 ubiquitin transferase n=2 Tax=Aspergillus niger TaxID=5061 RepID=A2R4S7_ASPNC|nr:uncharacterized protein An15g01450 [Aspergillus niger]CAL00959.1 unnamed protein product [Aspergillus niger]